jgi:hypothetical protein
LTNEQNQIFSRKIFVSRFLQPTVPREQQLLFELMGDLQTFLRPLAAKFITTASDLTGRRLCHTKQRFIEK